MANPNQLLYNVLQECSLPNAAEVAAKLIEEEVFWSHITDAYGSRGDIGVHNLLRDIVKTWALLLIITYLDGVQQNAASSSAGRRSGGGSDDDGLGGLGLGSSSGDHASAARSSSPSDQVTLAVTVVQGIRTLVARRMVNVSRGKTFAEVAELVVDGDADIVSAVADQPLTVKLYANAQCHQAECTLASVGDKIGSSAALGYGFATLAYRPRKYSDHIEASPHSLGLH